jgi:hypothetical protein
MSPINQLTGSIRAVRPLDPKKALWQHERHPNGHAASRAHLPSKGD